MQCSATYGDRNVALLPSDSAATTTAAGASCLGYGKNICLSSQQEWNLRKKSLQHARFFELAMSYRK